MRSVAVYQLGSSVKIIGKSTTKDHKIVIELPPEEVCITDDLSVIGRAVTIAMGKSRLEIDLAGTKADCLAESLGVKSWKDLVKKSRYCSVTEKETSSNIFVIDVCRKSGVYGFDAIGEEFLVDKNNVQAIGEKVRLALERFQIK